MNKPPIAMSKLMLHRFIVASFIIMMKTLCCFFKGFWSNEKNWSSFCSCFLPIFCAFSPRKFSKGCSIFYEIDFENWRFFFSFKKDIISWKSISNRLIYKRMIYIFSQKSHLQHFYKTKISSYIFLSLVSELDENKIEFAQKVLQG